MEEAPWAQPIQRVLSMECISQRLCRYVTSASLAIEIDAQDISLLVRQRTPAGSTKDALKELFTGLREEGVEPGNLYMEYIPYNGVTHIVLGDDEEVSLVPRESALGRALFKAAFEKKPREVHEHDFTPPPAEVVSLPESFKR